MDNLDWPGQALGWQAPMFVTHQRHSTRARLTSLLTGAVLVGSPLIIGVAPALAAQPATSPTSVRAAAQAPTSAAATRATATSRSLRYGQTSSQVKAMQKLLLVRQTGYFGPLTLAAVKRVQRGAKLRVTGVIDAATRTAIERAARQRAQSSRSMGRVPTARSVAPAASKRYAQTYISAKYGWGSAQFQCLSVMWDRESRWKYWVSNPNGRYHGIPQTSSHEWSKDGYTRSQYMGSPEVQIKVGTRYIKSRYGSPCGAWNFWRSHHWY